MLCNDNLFCYSDVSDDLSSQMRSRGKQYPVTRVCIKLQNFVNMGVQ